jgi:hypothetical protein
VIEIHDALEFADHVQSLVVATATLPVAPANGAECMVVVAVTWHFELVGATVEMDDDPHAAAIHAASTVRIADRHRGKRLGLGRMRSSRTASALPEHFSTTSSQNAAVVKRMGRNAQLDGEKFCSSFVTTVGHWLGR